MKADEMRPYIWITPARQGGVPCIGGTRIPVDTFAGWFEEEDGIDEIAHSYNLTRADVICAMWFNHGALYPDQCDKRTRKGKWLAKAYSFLARCDDDLDPGEFPKTRDQSDVTE